MGAVHAESFVQGKCREIVGLDVEAPSSLAGRPCPPPNRLHQLTSHATAPVFGSNHDLTHVGLVLEDLEIYEAGHGTAGALDHEHLVPDLLKGIAGGRGIPGAKLRMERDIAGVIDVGGLAHVERGH
jgi:hypothetical protein